MPKPGKLTLRMLLMPKPGGAESPEDDDEMEESAESESEGGDELPPGLLEAVSEMRSASSDEDAARAFKNAMHCCGRM
jgi:hypothetical protein